jgi:hypothetical protein
MTTKGHANPKAATDKSAAKPSWGSSRSTARCERHLILMCRFCQGKGERDA